MARENGRRPVTVADAKERLRRAAREVSLRADEGALGLGSALVARHPKAIVAVAALAGLALATGPGRRLVLRGLTGVAARAVRLIAGGGGGAGPGGER